MENYFLSMLTFSPGFANSGCVNCMFFIRSKYSLGHGECGFYNPAENFLLKVGKNPKILDF